MARAAGLVALALVLLAAVLFRQAPPPDAPRDRIVPAPVPAPDQIAAVAFGTSLTARAFWPARLEAALAGCGFSSASVSVRALAGAGSPDGPAMVEAAGAGHFNLAFVEFAINDADLVDGVSLSDSLMNHRAMVRSLRFRHPGIAIVLVTTNPVAGLQRLKRPKLMAYDDLYAPLAAEEGVSLFDGTARWIAAGPPKGALPDGLHPDPEVEAALFTRPLAGTIARIFGRTCTS